MDPSQQPSNAVEEIINGKTYIITPHPASKGKRLALKMLALGAKPLANLIQKGIDSKNKAMSAGDVVDKDVAEVLGDLGLNLNELAGDLSFVLNALAENDELLVDLFHHTKREGQWLRAEAAFDGAYSANYAEMYQAAIKIIQVNGFLSFGITPSA